MAVYDAVQSGYDVSMFAETLVVYETGQVRQIWPFFKRRTDTSLPSLLAQLQASTVL